MSYRKRGRLRSSDRPGRRMGQRQTRALVKPYPKLLANDRSVCVSLLLLHFGLDMAYRLQCQRATPILLLGVRTALRVVRNSVLEGECLHHFADERITDPSR